MDEGKVKSLLQRLARDEKALDSPVLEHLAGGGYIKIAEVTNQDTPVGQREFLFVSFTEKGKKLLESA